MSEYLILLVEDNPNDEELALRALKKTNLTDKVIVTRDGAEALDFLFARGAYSSRDTNKLPQVVFLDLNLPKLGGLDVLRSIRANEKTRLLPVIILTSSKQERDLIDGYNLGANSYVVKPVDFTQYTETVRELGLYWLLRNQPAPQVK